MSSDMDGHLFFLFPCREVVIGSRKIALEYVVRTMKKSGIFQIRSSFSFPFIFSDLSEHRSMRGPVTPTM